MGERCTVSAKVAVITGATSGIGLAVACQLALRGFRLVCVGRSTLRSAAAQAALATLAPGSRVDFKVADLGSQAQVRALAAEIRTLLESEQNRLDLLIHCAGTVSAWYMATEDGYETTFAVNHLAPYLLTRELLPLLERSGAARIITTSSGSHYRTRMRWRDVMHRVRYGCLAAYKQSKLANVLFTNELNRRLRPSSGIRSFAVDPGLVNTAIGEKGTSVVVRWAWRMRRRKGVSPDEAAATFVHLATCLCLEDDRASYWKECRPRRPSPFTEREDAMLRLWELSERLCSPARPFSGAIARNEDRPTGTVDRTIGA